MTKYTQMLGRVVTISTYAIMFCVVGNMVMPALIVDAAQSQAVSSSTVVQPKLSANDIAMQKRVSGLMSDLESASKSSSKGVSASSVDNKSVLDKYINKIGKVKLKKLSDSYDKLNETDKSKFLSGLSDVELSAFVAGVLMPYEQKVTITNTPQKNTASKAVSASSAGPIISQCNISNSNDAYIDSQGSYIFEFKFSIYSCYTNLYNKVYGSNTFYTPPTVVYLKSGWNVDSLSKSCDANTSWYYYCTANYSLKSNFLWLTFYKGASMTIYRSLYNSPLVPRVSTWNY